MPPWDKYQAVGTDQPSGPWQKYSAAQEKPERNLLDVPGEAYANLVPSAKRFGENIVQPFIHPIQTAESIGKLGLGVGEKLGLPGTQGYGQYADVAWQALKDRYGGWEQLKNTMATDPVGFVGDLAALAEGGGGLAARLPGVVGEVGEAVQTVGRVTNPLNVAQKAIPTAGKAVTKVLGGYTGMGSEGLEQARLAGKAGGPEQAAHLANLRDPEGTVGALVPKARAAMNEIKKQRSIDYQNGMRQIGQNPAILDFNDIDAALANSKRIQTVAGQTRSQLFGGKATKAEKTRNRIEGAINTFKQISAQDPANLRTAMAFDQLKQHIGTIRDELPFGSPQRKVAEEMYGAVRNTIVKQDKRYADVMKDYEEASNNLTELEKTLSLGRKASEDTALRKLLSTTRSGVNTNFGRRFELAKALNKIDPTLIPSLAGQAGSSFIPQGLARIIPTGVGVAETASQGLAAVLRDPKVIATIMASSPRLWSEIYSKIGSGQRQLKNLTPQAIIDLAQKVNPELLKQIATGSRVTGAITNAPQ